MKRYLRAAWYVVVAAGAAEVWRGPLGRVEALVLATDVPVPVTEGVRLQTSILVIIKLHVSK